VDLLEKCKEREAISQILNISRIGNQLMQAEKPWKLIKSTDEVEKARAASVVSLCVNISCLLAVLVEPFMPKLSEVSPIFLFLW
jgi:methionyl-tRNA synthetase